MCPLRCALRRGERVALCEIAPAILEDDQNVRGLEVAMNDYFLTQRL